MIVVSQYGGGIFNQLTSFEVSYGLSKFLGDRVILHDVNKKIAGREEFKKEDFPSFINNNNDVKLLDIIEFEESENLIIKNEPIPELLSDGVNGLDFKHSYILHYFNLNQNKKDYEENFADGRKEILPEKDYIMRGPNLTYYSRFFFNMDSEFDRVISSVKFKKEYYDFAQEIVNIVGNFNGCHIRRRDHVNVVNIDGDMFRSGIEKFENNLPILISTDEYYNPMFKNNKCILIEDIINNNLKKEFMQLQNNSDIAFAVISNLVMRQSSDFIGTGTSTFTGHIQRNLYKNKNIGFKFFNENLMPTIEFGKTKYSWEQVQFDTEYKAVLREWPECRLSV